MRRASELLVCPSQELDSRTIHIQAGQHVITAADPFPDDLRQAFACQAYRDGYSDGITDGMAAASGGHAG